MGRLNFVGPSACSASTALRPDRRTHHGPPYAAGEAFGAVAADMVRAKASCGFGLPLGGPGRFDKQG
jgi:hypothetical protein